VERADGATATLVDGEVTAEPAWTVELPPTGPGERYALDVLADGLGQFEGVAFVVD
jgi:hypothetical protein